MATYSRPDIYALQSIKGNLDVFEPTDFQMFVQRKFRNGKGEDDVERLHEYTKSVNNPLAPDLPMNDWQTVNRDFPFLAQMCEQRSLDCNVLIAEASIAFPQETWKDKDGSPLPGVELGISFLCSSRHLPPTPKDKSGQAVCSNSFYENGHLIKEYNQSSEVRLEPSGHVAGVETQIKFGSTFWARTLGRLATKLLDTSKDHKDDISSSLRTINALQEVFALTDHGPERILVVHWSFRHSTSTCGRASWRKLLLPSTQHAHDDAAINLERADSMFEPYSQFADQPVSHSTQSQTQPALQSPFEYDNSSGSALSSATWPTCISEGSFIDHQADHSNNFAENNFDFNAGSINIAYDQTFNFGDFDSSAFTFDPTTGDFAADPALQDYSTEWCESQVPAFDTSHVIGTGGPFGTGLGIDNHGQSYDTGYVGHYEQPSYDGTHDQQAYGGAGQDLIKEEDALAALADASFIASAL
jgi:transcriptional enhancer factor